tara:strand:+ start:104 stop:913 length:810 start_codon:yes stop_codon:yes gene_type:complete
MRPATTSHFDIFINQPTGDSDYTWNSFKSENGLEGFSQDLLHLSCSQVSLPGSSFMTHEATSDYTGVTEKHAYRRNFDGKVDLTFYVMQSPSNVNSDQATPNRYLTIRFFEGWMKYISAEENQLVANENYSYRMRYPKDYYGGLSVIKYERDYNSFLNYNFISAYPLSINSMPLSYDSSDLLKVTVSMSYTRYYITDVAGSTTDRTKIDPRPKTPQEQAQENSIPLQDTGFETPKLSTADRNAFAEIGYSEEEILQFVSQEANINNGRL